jgi:anti-sigma regulatory factor (Ser/Thr protein kinase)
MSSPVENRTFGVSPGEIAEIDRWVEAVGAQWGASKRSVFGTRLCIAELAANVLDHGVASSADDRIAITLRRLSDGIAIEFIDSREPFDPTRTAVAASAATIDSVEESGRGLLLLQAYANDLSYHHDGTYNRVTLKVASDHRSPSHKIPVI